MRFFRRSAFALLFAGLAALPLAAHAQMTSITATSVNSGSGSASGAGPVTGTLCATAVDQFGSPIAVTRAGGGYFQQGQPFCQALSAGALTGTLQVPNSCTDSNPGHGYQFTIYNTTTHNASAPFNVYGICGTSWSLDTYTPAASVPTAQAFTLTMGTGSAPTSCTAPALDYRTNSGIVTQNVCVGGVFLPVSSDVRSHLPVFTQTSFPGSSLPTGYVNNGATVTVSGGELNFSGGAGNYSQSVDYGGTTTSRNWCRIVHVIVPAPASAAYGFGLGLRSNATYVQQGVGSLFSLATGYAGTLSIASVTNGTGTNVVSSSPTFTWSAGDKLEARFCRSFQTFSASVTDVISGAGPVTASYTFSLQYPATYSLPNVGKQAIYSFGGTFSVVDDQIIDYDQVGLPLLIVADSKGQPYFAGTYAQGWTAILGAGVPLEVLAGGDDATPDVLNNLPEILARKPQAVLLEMSYNDTCNGASLGTAETNYASIVSQLTGAGITVYNMIGLYSTACTSNAALESWISSTYPTTTFSANLKNYSPSYILAGDGVHPSAAAQVFIANAAANFLISKGVPFNYQSYAAALSGPPASATLVGETVSAAAGDTVTHTAMPASNGNMLDLSTNRYLGVSNLAYICAQSSDVLGSCPITFNPANGAIGATSIAPTNGFSGTKTAGSCVLTIVSGVITSVTGC